MNQIDKYIYPLGNKKRLESKLVGFVRDVYSDLAETFDNNMVEGFILLLQRGRNK